MNCVGLIRGPPGVGLRQRQPCVCVSASSVSPPLGQRQLSRTQASTCDRLQKPAVAQRQRRPTQCAARAAAQQAELPVSEPAKRSLERTADASNRVGWISFWTQLSLSVVSAGILLFSVAFTSVNGPGATLYLTLFGIAASFLSTFRAYGLTRLARQLRIYAKKGPQGAGGRIRKADVRARMWFSAGINLGGIAATLLGLQATVGLLVAKTLTNATANPFLSGGSGSYNPVLALDVFLVQASTNTLLAHFASLLFNLWLIKVVGEPGEGTQAPWPTTTTASASA